MPLQVGLQGSWEASGEERGHGALYHLHPLALALGGLWPRIFVSQVVQMIEEAPSTKVI